MAILESLLLNIYWVGRVPLVLQVILTAKMVLHLLDPESQINVSKLSRESGVSRQTLYTWGHRAIAILGMACIPNLAEIEASHEIAANQTEITELREQVRHAQERNQELEKQNLSLQSEVDRLSSKLQEIVDKAIVVRSFRVKCLTGV